MAALVREAVALSGLEGLGVPAVLRFGRLPRSGRPYMIRELVDGKSLGDLMASRGPTLPLLQALIRTSEQLTLIHRGGFFHGDIKPANIIVSEDGGATLVDLGLAAPWQDAGITAPGLTPKYAAPEVLGGRPLTVRAEVYALGAALRETVERGQASLDRRRAAALIRVAERATEAEPEKRFPSADEFGAALSRATHGHQQASTSALAEKDSPLVWPIVGIEQTAGKLLKLATGLQAGGILALSGASGSGRSVILRRLAWGLGVEGRPLVWIDEALGGNPELISQELQSNGDPAELILLVDDVEELAVSSLQSLEQALLSGARMVSVGTPSFAERPKVFKVPKLSTPVAAELLRRPIPSLTETMASKLNDAAKGLPGELKRFVGLLAREAIASEEDIDQVLFGLQHDSTEGGEPLAQAQAYLQRGRYTEAARALEQVTDGDALAIAVAQARLFVGIGQGRRAFDILAGVKDEARRRSGSEQAHVWTVWFGRAHIAVAEHDRAIELLSPVSNEQSAVGAEALAYLGLALGHSGKREAAENCLRQAVEVARDVAEPRVQGLALTCLGLALLRSEDANEAQEVLRQALGCAQTAGDAGTLGTVQLNLGVVLRALGNVAGAIELFEAAVDMGKRSGRRATVRQALLNLANTDLHLGRLARARTSIEALEEQRESLPARMRAHLSGLQATLFALRGELKLAVQTYQECGALLEQLGALTDAAEAQLEAVLVASQADEPDVDAMAEDVARAEEMLGDRPVHRALLPAAHARVAMLRGETERAREMLDDSLKVAQENKQRDWVWRVLSMRAELSESCGQHLIARRDRVEAVTVLEEIAARLPRDLREVFWNDDRRRELRTRVEDALAGSRGEPLYEPVKAEASAIGSAISTFTRTPLERRLARLLETNRELLGELDLQRLSSRVIGFAVELLQAERGCVILRSDSDELEVYSSSTRRGDQEHREFSRSIAQKVLASREPVVSLNARDDARLSGFVSVHQMLLESVACVPIVAREGDAIGALYVETRSRPGRGFQRDIPTLRAFADQVALAIETSRLISENRARADALETSNKELTVAKNRLKELLGDRTKKLNQARRRLRDVRDTLLGRFGYQGIVGTSERMRRCYSLIDRIKDTDIPILITGESGTGKEVVARAMHRASERAKSPFLGVNCGAIPEHLLESELFGNVRGAFTGADKDRKGLLREARGGTVLLDEIGEMPPKMQAGLLRVLQERKVRPVGGSQEMPVDCRFVFATHRNLESMVKDGSFREDLYYRIRVLELDLPPLRERSEDIPLLVDHFLGIFAERYQREKKALTREALRRLARHDWPGNVRQLEHVVLNAWVLGDDELIDVEDLDLPDERRSETLAIDRTPERVALDESQSDVEVFPPVAPSSSRSKKETLSQHRRDEKARIVEALEACSWNRVKAAELIGIPRRTFYRRLRKYGIQ